MRHLRIPALVAAIALSAPAAALATAPGATTGEASNVTASGATLNGVVNPNKEDTTYYFEYGTTTAYGMKTTSGLASGNAGKTASDAVGGLAPGTTYHFRLVATNPSGTTVGADKTFTTLAEGQAPNSITAVANPVTMTFGRSTIISGQLTGPNNANVEVQLFQNPHPYTGGFKATGAAVRTDAAGKYAFVVAPGLHTRYQVTAKASPPVASSIVQVLVRYKVVMRVNDTTVRRGQLVRFSGYVAPAHDGLTVKIQRRIGTGSFRTVARTTLRKSATAGRSVYGKSLRVYRRATYRVRIDAHLDHARGTSSRRTIRIG